MSRRQALVLGGSGAVGRQVVARLVQEGVDVTFTYHSNQAAASALERETGATGVQADFRVKGAARALVESMRSQGGEPSLLVACAGVAGPAVLADTDTDALEESIRINGLAPVEAAIALGGQLEGEGDFVFVGALYGAQSVAIPPAFAASQGMLAPAAMSLAKALGPKGIRVNVVALGLLDEGLSGSLDPALGEAFERHSALRRKGTAVEAARSIVGLALHNTYLSGKVVPVNGGI